MLTSKQQSLLEAKNKMVKFGKGVVKCRILILILGVLLLIPSLFGMLSTRINYDMLTYLPEDMDTVKGQNILLDDFGKGAFSMVVVEGLETKEVADLKDSAGKPCRICHLVRQPDGSVGSNGAAA